LADRAAFRESARGSCRGASSRSSECGEPTAPRSRRDTKLLREFGTDYLTVRHENVSDEQLTAFSGMRASCVFDNADARSPRARARLLSSSYIPAAGHASYDPMLAALTALFEEHQRDGKVAMEYDLRMYASRLDA
jgi:hypothetical protein